MLVLIAAVLLTFVASCALLVVRDRTRQPKVLGCGKHGVKPSRTPIITASSDTSKLVLFCIIVLATITGSYRAGYKESQNSSVNYDKLVKDLVVSSKGAHVNDQQSEAPATVWPEIVPPMPIYTGDHVRARVDRMKTLPIK